MDFHDARDRQRYLSGDERAGFLGAAAGIAAGPHATAKGLRHGYGVHAIGCGVPLNLLSRWMGHASLEVTALYANALGAEEQAIAAKMWS